MTLIRLEKLEPILTEEEITGAWVDLRIGTATIRGFYIELDSSLILPPHEHLDQVGKHWADIKRTIRQAVATTLP